eukprot:SAG31_NODE_15087_length_771_cov_1.465774_1_plen_173_part_00
MPLVRALLLAALATTTAVIASAARGARDDDHHPRIAPPSRLHVEYLPSEAETAAAPAPIISTAHPRFSFVPGDAEQPVRNGTVSAYRIIVAARHAADGMPPAWDSGKVPAANGSVEFPASIRCEPALVPEGAWLWSAQYWDGQGQASPLGYGRFDTGPISAADWATSWWLGR